MSDAEQGLEFLSAILGMDATEQATAIAQLGNAGEAAILANATSPGQRVGMALGDTAMALAGLYGLAEGGAALYLNWRGGVSRAAPGPIDLMRPGDQFLRNAANRLDVDPNGLLDVVAHGSPTAVEIQGQVVNHRVLASLIERNPQFVGQDVRLLSCGTGAQADGLAQNLANRLGVQVTAPSDILWAFPNGRLSIGPTPAASTGQWITFRPGGKP